MNKNTIMLRMSDAVQTIEDLIHDGEPFEIQFVQMNPKGRMLATVNLDENECQFTSTQSIHHEVVRRSAIQPVRCFIYEHLKNCKPDQIITMTKNSTQLA